MKRMLSFALAVFLLFVGIVPAYAASGTTITASKGADTPYTGRAYIGTKGETKVGELPPLPDGWEWSDSGFALTTSFAQTDVIQRDGSGREINRVTVKVKVLKDGTETSDIGGNVSERGAPVPGAVVELRLGTIKVDSTVTDDYGNYDFKAVESGIYNIVVIKEDGKTKTEMVTIDSSITTINVELPVSAVSSLLEFSGYEIPGARAVVNHSVVGGLDTIAAKQNPGNGERITIKLTVAPKTYTETAEQKAIKAKAGNENNIEFLDMSLWRQVNDGNPENIDDANNTLLTIVIPFDFTKVKVSDMVFLRSHDGKVAELTTAPNEYGEYFAADTNAGIITLYAMKFSEYGIAYERIHEHEWDSDFTVDAEASCTQNGSKSIHCKTCAEVKDVTALPAKGHRFGDWQTVTAPTCEGNGAEKRVCSVCGFTETRNMDFSGHAWKTDYTVDKEPTCTQDGSKSIHCNNCDSVKDSTVIPLLGHKWGSETVVKEATKNEDGEKIFTCERCGETRHIVIPKTGDIHKCSVHWFMIVSLALFIALFVLFTLKKKKQPAFITCGVFGAVTIVLAFFGGCTICTVLSGINLVVIAAGAIFIAFKNKPPGGIDS